MKTTCTTLMVMLASMIIATGISANKIAYTEDGEKVLLRDGGT